MYASYYKYHVQGATVEEDITERRTAMPAQSALAVSLLVLAPDQGLRV